MDRIHRGRPVLVPGHGGWLRQFGHVEDLAEVMAALLGNERAYQKELYGGRLYAVDYGVVDFAAIARGMGAWGEQVTHPGDLEAALKRALASNQPAVVDVAIDKETLAPVLFGRV